MTHGCSVSIAGQNRHIFRKINGKDIRPLVARDRGLLWYATNPVWSKYSNGLKWRGLGPRAGSLFEWASPTQKWRLQPGFRGVTECRGIEDALCAPARLCRRNNESRPGLSSRQGLHDTCDPVPWTWRRPGSAGMHITLRHFSRTGKGALRVHPNNVREFESLRARHSYNVCLSI